MAADTIFALGSGAGTAGVAVIRLSGPQTRRTLAALCGDLPPPRHAALRIIRDPRSAEEIDSGLILFFEGPRSFTGEDSAELQVHGSVGVARRLLGLLGQLDGLRAAEAGEFAHRAFLNGKLDLVGVEALGDLLQAETAAQARMARQYQGRLRAATDRWRERLIALIALTEAYIDFIDQEDVASRIDSDSQQELEALAGELEAAVRGLAGAERMRRGFRVAIMGPPNSGKSTLLNALAGREVAITSPVAGTTRDLIEVHLDLGGYPVTLVDTAGLREASDAIEGEGIRRAHKAAGEADLVLWLSPVDSPAEPAIPNALLVASKSDLSDSFLKQSAPLSLSAATGSGVDTLIAELASRASKVLETDSGDVLVAHERQAGEIARASEALRRARAIGSDQLELRAEELRVAASALERLLGKVGYDEVLGAIFARFCIGK